MSWQGQPHTAQCTCELWLQLNRFQRDGTPADTQECYSKKQIYAKKTQKLVDMKYFIPHLKGTAHVKLDLSIRLQFDVWSVPPVMKYFRLQGCS